MAPSINSSKRTSKRYSTYSASPSFATTNTANSLPSADTGMAEIRQLTQGLDRLENKHLQQQRFVPSQKKTDDLSKLSLGAKVERALGRRMTDQDAVLRVKRPNLVSSKSVPISSFMDEKVLLKA
ncbi:hypothetical protein B0A52_01805 [Exophiala mesophila]|uniref:Uncharacterized protein n=1 Tax=Exophiala mesophila TaxID=212818 RepID=A0A438NG17_EXOME|nr:hypothetical protein B0A52_01805 [Exophiala mesophila]